MFLSLKKHMDGADTDPADAFRRMSSALLRTMRIHALPTGAEAGHQYQASLLSLENRVDVSSRADQVDGAATEAIRAYESHVEESHRFLNAQSGQMASMIAMLTATVGTISASSRTAADRLGQVERRMERLSYASDLPEIREELARCLEMVRTESFRQREASAETIHAMQRTVSDARERIPEAEGAAEPLLRDALTGLAGRADAEDALCRHRGRADAFAALLPVDRLQLVNTRFGTASTERLLLYFLRYFQENLKANDLLFRWSENAYLAILVRAQPADSVRADLARFASAKLELVLEHHGRELLIPASSTWALFPMADGRSHSSLVDKIETFLRSDLHSRNSF